MIIIDKTSQFEVKAQREKKAYVGTLGFEFIYIELVTLMTHPTLCWGSCYLSFYNVPYVFYCLDSYIVRIDYTYIYLLLSNIIY